MFKEDCSYISGQGNTCNDLSKSVEEPYTANLVGQGILLLLLAVAILAVIFLLARYSYAVATRNGRSRIGFVWLSILFPFLSWVICLIIDSNQNRYSEAEREKFKIPDRAE